jgi:penicillin-binding protein 1A
LQLESGKWTVENWQGRSYGNPTLSEATTLSDNTVYARLVVGIGHDRVARLMAACGLPALPSPGPTVTLGVLPRGVAPVALAASYSAFAESGIVAMPTFVLGRERTKTSPIAADVAMQIREVLHTYVAAYLSPDMADGWGKTGTPDDGRVGWFVGVRGRVASAVALGGGRSIGPAKAYGAARVWTQFQDDIASMRKLVR